MGKKNRQRRRAEGKKTHETVQEKYDRVMDERTNYWRVMDGEAFQPTRDELAYEEATSFSTPGPRLPRLYKLATFFARRVRNNGDDEQRT